MDELENDLNAALQSLQNCSGVIVFADLAGGSPYKTAAVIAQNYQNVEIIAGTNLPMLCEIVMARTFVDDAASLAEMAVNTGKDQISRFDMASLISSTEEENDDFSDGI